MSGNDFCDVGNENRNGEFLSRGWETLRDEKKRSQLRERQGNEKKTSMLSLPGMGTGIERTKKNDMIIQKKYLEIFGVRLSFVTKYSETPPPPFLTTPPFSEATGIPAHPCIHFVRVVTSYVVNKARKY